MGKSIYMYIPLVNKTNKYIRHEMMQSEKKTMMTEYMARISSELFETGKII